MKIIFYYLTKIADIVPASRELNALSGMFEVQPAKAWSRNVNNFVDNLLVRVAQKIYLQVSSTGDHSLFLDIELSSRDVETMERRCDLNIQSATYVLCI